MLRFELDNKYPNEETGNMICDEFSYAGIQAKLKECACVEISLRNKVFYCYQEFYPEYLNIDFALQQLKRVKCLFLQQLWEDEIKDIEFNGCNEWVFQLVPLLRNEGIHVKVDGEIWECICGTTDKTQIGKERKRVNTYGKDYDLYHEFSWVMDILQFQRWKIMNETKTFLSQIGANVYICTIPEFRDLEKSTTEEKLRNAKELNITNGRINFEDKDIIVHLRQVYGNDFNEIRKRRRKESMRHWVETVCAPEYYLKNRKIYGQGMNRCYLIGPCIVEGNTASVGKSFPELLQKFLDLNLSEKYAVMTVSLPFYVVDNYLKIVQYLAIRSKDIIICIDEISENCIRAGNVEPDIDFKELYDRRGDETWFADKPIHTTGFANNMLAQQLAEFIRRKDIRKENNLLQVGKGYLLKNEVDQIDKYLSTIDRFQILYTRGRIGAIVMNCNPITLGHEYLIDFARTQVDCLYIFVVQEDKSYIPFDDRLKLVRLYAEQYDNIKVNPSGALILSSKTMPMYFEKETKKEVIVDAWKDIEIFAQYIAPRLGIGVRFVGEEKTDMVTWQYNREMERTLRDYGIDFREIPRKEIDGVAVSATNARKALKEKEWAKLSTLVSEKTYTYLYNKYTSEQDFVEGGFCETKNN